MRPVYVVTGAMRSLLTDDAFTSGAVAVRKKRALHIVVSEGLLPTALERGINSVYGRFSLAASVLWVIGLVAALGFGAAFVIFMATLDIFNEIFKSVSYSLSLPTTHPDRMYFFAILVGGAFVVSFLPRLMMNSESGVGQGILSALLNDERRTMSRLSHRLGIAILLGRIKEIHIWNPFQFAKDYKVHFLTRLLGHRANFYVYLHHDEVSEWLAFASLHGIQWEAATPVQDRPEGKEAGAGADDRLLRAYSRWIGHSPEADISARAISQVFKQLMGPTAHTFLGVLLASSTRSAREPWASALEKNVDLGSGLVSLSFANRIAQQIIPSTTISDGAAQALMRTVFERCIRDYEVLRETAFYETALLVSPLDIRNTANTPEWSQIARTLNLQVRGAARQLTDSSALFSSLVHYDADTFVSKDYRELLEAFAESAHAEGNLLMSGVVADVYGGRDDSVRSDNEVELQDAHPREVLDGVSIKHLGNLADLFEGAGRFASALDLQSWLESVEPVNSHIRRARLLERLGHYSGALDFLLKANKDETTRVILTLTGEGEPKAIPAHIQSLAVRYNLQWAWIIISGKLSRADGNEHVAREILGRLHKVAADPHFDFLTPMDRWQLWNYSGLLAEWQRNFDEASQCFDRASELPGVPLRWKAASQINKGIALRASLLQKVRRQEDTTPVLGAVMEDSFNSIMRGTEIKIALGDVDEAAVGLHNAAYTALTSIALKGPEVASPQRIARLSRLGLGILSKTGSSKKRYLLLAENTFASLLPTGNADDVKNAKANAEALASASAAQEIPEADGRDILELYRLMTGQNEGNLNSVVAVIVQLAAQRA